MEVVKIKGYGEYLKQLKNTFQNRDKMPALNEIKSFISAYHLDTDWGIVVDDVRKDITEKILIKRKQKNGSTRYRRICSYKQYLEKLKSTFGIPVEMPKDTDIDTFIEEYGLESNWGITIDDVKEDLREFIAGNYNAMYSETVKESPKPRPLPPYVSKTVFRSNSVSSSSNRPEYRDSNPSYVKQGTSIASNKKKSTSGKKKERQVTIFIDGDNHFDEGQKGIERTPKNTRVRVVFSQAGAKRKFDRKFGNRPNVSSKLVKPGDQAVDNQIKAEAGQLLKNGNQDITFISQDPDFAEYRDRKKNTGLGNRISTAKSVSEKLNRKK